MSDLISETDSGVKERTVSWVFIGKLCVAAFGVGFCWALGSYLGTHIADWNLTHFLWNSG